MGGGRLHPESFLQSVFLYSSYSDQVACLSDMMYQHYLAQGEFDLSVKVRPLNSRTKLHCVGLRIQQMTADEVKRRLELLSTVSTMFFSFSLFSSNVISLQAWIGAQSLGSQWMGLKVWKMPAYCLRSAERNG